MFGRQQKSVLSEPVNTIYGFLYNLSKGDVIVNPGESVGYVQTLREQMLVSEFKVLPGREGGMSRQGEYMPWRWDQENRRASPRVFSALRAHRNVWHIWTRTGHPSFSAWSATIPAPTLLTQLNSNMTNLKFRFIRVRELKRWTGKLSGRQGSYCAHIFKYTQTLCKLITT